MIVTFTVTDGASSDTGTAKFVVVGVNDAPTTANGTVSAQEDVTVVVPTVHSASVMLTG